MEQIELKELYNRIAKLTKPKFDSVKELEKAVGLKESIIQKWKSHVPAADKLFLVANALGVSIEYLLTGKEAPANTDNQSAPPTVPSCSFNELTERYQHLFADADFAKIAKVYDNTKIAAVKGILVGYFIATARANGVDTLTLVGY